MTSVFPGYRPWPPVQAGETEPHYDDVDFAALFVLGKDHHTVAAPLERMVENVLDWEHLPYVHPENFCSSVRLGSGRLWYRAVVGSPPAERGLTNTVRVCVHPSLRRWFLTLEDGPQAGLVFHGEATRVEADEIGIELTFFTATRPRNAAMGKALFDVYRSKLGLLYAQDIAMVVAREQGLHRNRDAGLAPGVSLGPVDAVVARAPFLITVRGRRVWVHHRDGELVTRAADCPHQGAQLPCPRDGETEVVCPWHAYRFDATTGRSTDGRNGALARVPGLVVRDGQLWLNDLDHLAKQEYNLD